ncbi:MAG: folylpolyglutamate synthase/dihydrofolate synthase family protein [Acidimicrobiia bacterium]|jgi:dihydrofolate synthase/folylpolyglutamate synthase
MNYDQAVAYVERHIGLGGRPGLGRMRDLLDLMGRPEDGYPIIHVGGTNGKTSTSRLATLLLVAHGLTTGTLTSPHLQRIEERLAVNGRESTSEEFALAVSDVAAFADLREDAGDDPNTYFELTTAAGFAFFADQAVNAAVIEVGLGGRLDATNVVDADVCVVTSIGRDHTEHLGEDLAGIAGEKLAIAGPGSILVTGPLPGDASEVAGARGRELGIQHRRYGTDYGVEEYERGVGGWLATIAGAEATYEDVFLPLHGHYQLTNLAIAVAATEALIGRKLDTDAVKDAAEVATAPGRMEPLASSPFVMVDGAHNADGMATLVESLQEEYPTTKWHVLLGLMGDKNVDLIVERLAPVTSGLITTAVSSERSTSPVELADRAAETLSDVPVLAAESVETGLDMARAEAGPEGAVLVTGSLYLVGEVRTLLG